MPRMPFIDPEMPSGYQALCDQLQAEHDPARFRILVDNLNRLLSVHEKSLSREERGRE
jgi:hypothetical protein